MDDLGAYPGSNECALGFSMQLPKNVSKADFGVRAIAGNTRELDVLVKNQGTETSLQLELRLSIMGSPTPTSPTGSVMESVSANSTAYRQARRPGCGSRPAPHLYSRAQD